MDKKDLQHGNYYVGRCRNAKIARWNANEDCFYHWRTKYGQRFIETIKHPVDDQVYDVFVVDRECDFETEEIPFNGE